MGMLQSHCSQKLLSFNSETDWDNGWRVEEEEAQWSSQAEDVVMGRLEEGEQ